MVLLLHYEYYSVGLKYSLQCRAFIYHLIIPGKWIEIFNIHIQGTAFKYQERHNIILQLDEKGVIQMRRNNPNMTECRAFTRPADFPYLYLSEHF